MNKIPFCMPFFDQADIDAVNDLIRNPQKLTGEQYTQRCRHLLREQYKKEMLLTHSCTGALEISALLLNLQPGDEVIVPSFTFVSTANAFALFGARLVFVDMLPETLNIDPKEIEAAITPKTKAIVVMHYAAIGCEMNKIIAIAQEKGIPLIEDAAQCIGATYEGQLLGTFGQFGTLSFHNTKNITSGLGGALIINDEAFVPRAKIICQKGTNRDAFLEGTVDKYTWQDLGSSYMINELGAALLLGQIERQETIHQKRLALWNHYQTSLKEVEKFGFKRPYVPSNCKHNAHIYYLIAPTAEQATNLRAQLASDGITATSHYVPLHLSPAGKMFSAGFRTLPVCEDIYKRIVRLPLWEGLEAQQNHIIERIYDVLKNKHVTSVVN